MATAITFSLLIRGLVFGAEAPVAQPVTAPLAHPMKDVFAPAEPESVQISCRLGEKLDLCVTHRILTQDIESVVAPYRSKTETGGAGETVRRNLLQQCDVHTLLRLPTGIF